ncbi:unnamed protein product [Allacma fusca]|uniref:Cytosolic Fe-S cluster assembly factor NUBP2 homolog n=1 Tax=Allacma fusca TaxID=39272 RepID=A0A8J2KQF4_9HEXA|nr:unnamed protein product [Allacma fusca]
MVADNLLSEVKNIVLVLSGKGGVGKSTVAVQLALSLVADGKKVGILDIDICGPSIPQMFGIDSEVMQSDKGWKPVYTDDSKTLALMSIAFLLRSRNDAVVWRGPKKNSMIKQFVSTVDWGSLDYLIVDTPPGTSDEHMSVIESLAGFDNKSAVLVTTPQLISVGDVRREATFCEKTGIRVLGIVENMSGFVCPNCKDCTDIFAAGGGQLLATETGLDLITKIPIDPNLTKSGENGTNFVKAFQDSPAAQSVFRMRDYVQNKMS